MIPRHGMSAVRREAAGGVLRRAVHRCALSIVIVLSATSAVAHAQEASGADRDAAATAYDRGTSSFLSHDYPRAAQWFETAYRLAPNPQALLGAIRSHERAGDLLRAATLSLRAQAFHPEDEALARQATTLLTQATPLYLRVDVTCTAPAGLDAECTVELDGTVQSHTSFFVAPDADHRVVASFETGPAETTVRGAAGETQAISLEAPPAPVVVAAAGGGARATDGTDTTPTPGSGGGISPAFFVTGLVLTAAAGGVLIWSGVDALDGVPAYEADPTPERLADGQMRETRTNVMIGVTAGLAVTTLIFAIVTDWDGDPPAAVATGDGDTASEDVPGADDAERDPSPAAGAVSLESVSLAPIFDGSSSGLVVSAGGRF
jgi:hypothetical protein